MKVKEILKDAVHLAKVLGKIVIAVVKCVGKHIIMCGKCIKGHVKDILAKAK